MIALTYSQPNHHYTIQEYLELERTSEVRYEYVNGTIIMMSGSSPEHDFITLDVSTHLNIQLRDGSCQTFTANMRVQTKPNKKYRYPDVTVVFGEPQYNQDNPPSVTNPTLIIEVLSSSTATSDSTHKLREYTALGSVQDYLIIAQDKYVVVHYHRQPDDTWRVSTYSDLDTHIDLPSVGCQLPLAEIYRRVEETADADTPPTTPPDSPSSNP